MPTTTHSSLAEAGLADSTGYLDVNAETLQHSKYDNIFGLGDVLNVPTTKTFYGGVKQMHVLRKNVLRRLNGLPLTEKYNGYAKTSLPLSPSSITNVEHEYDCNGLKFSTDSFSTGLNYKYYAMRGKHNHENVLKFKGMDKYKYMWQNWFGKEDWSVPAPAAQSG